MVLFVRLKKLASSVLRLAGAEPHRRRGWQLWAGGTPERWPGEFGSYRSLLEGSLGVGATTAVGDGRDLAAEQRALVLVCPAGGDVIHARHHVVLGREGDDGHARGRGHHREVGQQLAHELELVEEVGLAHAGRLVHQEDELQAATELPQAPHAAPERAAQTLHFAPRRLLLAGRG